MKPNIIIVNPDQMRGDAMRHAGNPAAYTPALDALAGEGMSFTQAYCQNPVCVPSRISFMTGLYPHVNGHRTMTYLQRPYEENLFSDMKAAGYYILSSTRGDLMAGQHGRYHRKFIDEYIKVPRPAKGIKEFQGDRGAPDGDNYYSFLDGIIPSDHDDENVDNIDDLIIEGAINAIKNRHGNKPLFMFLALFFPHPPYQIEKKYYDLIDPDLLPPRIPTVGDDHGKPSMETGLRDGLRVAGWSEERMNELRRIYLAMCAKADDQLGRLVGALKSEGIWDDTALLFFSDHGDYTGDFGLVEKAQNVFPDCLVNVPLIIKPPAGIRFDSGINTNLVELTDIPATVAEFAEYEIHRSHFSRSLLPMLRDKNRVQRECVCSEGGRLAGEQHCDEYHSMEFSPSNHYAPRLLLQSSEEGEHGKAAMLRTARYKYVRRLYEQDEFYDLSAGESVNEIGNPRYGNEIDNLRSKLLDWYQETTDIVPQDYDERFMPEFLRNHMVAMGIPGFLFPLLKLYLFLRRMRVSDFLASYNN